MIPVWFVWLQILVITSGLSVGMLLYPRSNRGKEDINTKSSTLRKVVSTASARIWNLLFPLILPGIQTVSKTVIKSISSVRSTWTQVVNRILGRTDIDLRSPASAYLLDISQHKKELIKNIENNVVVD